MNRNWRTLDKVQEGTNNEMKEKITFKDKSTRWEVVVKVENSDSDLALGDRLWGSHKKYQGFR